MLCQRVRSSLLFPGLHFQSTPLFRPASEWSPNPALVKRSRHAWHLRDCPTREDSKIHSPCCLTWLDFKQTTRIFGKSLPWIGGSVFNAPKNLPLQRRSGYFQKSWLLPSAPQVLPPGSDDCRGASISQWPGRLQRQVCSCLGTGRSVGNLWMVWCGMMSPCCVTTGINRVTSSAWGQSKNHCRDVQGKQDLGLKSTPCARSIAQLGRRQQQQQQRLLQDKFQLASWIMSLVSNAFRYVRTWSRDGLSHTTNLGLVLLGS